jgi:hypothetical protein
MINPLEYLKALGQERLNGGRPTEEPPKDAPKPTRAELLERLHTRQRRARNEQVPRRRRKDLKTDKEKMAEVFYKECGGDVKTFCTRMGISKEAMPAVLQAAQKIVAGEGIPGL